jgi:oxygen-independent coproporphyrinogen-3 oxidase
VDKYNLKKDYMQAVLVQTNSKLLRLKEEKIETVFIGGGTPSCVDAHYFEKFFELISPFLQKDAEITTEANPNSANKQWLEMMQSFGVNRISFGVQSFNEAKLKFLGRSHTHKQAIEAVQNAFKLGFENISLDLIYATHLDNISLLTQDLKTAMSLPINHLSAYALTLEEGTKFQDKSDYTNPCENLAKEFIEAIKSYGFSQYEISNFGKYKSRHNLGYWEGKEYIGIGAGAVGFENSIRYYPHKEVEKYIQNPLHVRVENLTKEDLHVEKIFLGLRSEIGIQEEALTQKELEKALLLLDENKLTCKDKKFYNNDYLLSDEIALFLLD